MDSEPSAFVAYIPSSLALNYGHFHVKEKLIYFMLLIIREKNPKFDGTLMYVCGTCSTFA